MGSGVGGAQTVCQTGYWRDSAGSLVPGAAPIKLILALPGPCWPHMCSLHVGLRPLGGGRGPQPSPVTGAFAVFLSCQKWPAALPQHIWTGRRGSGAQAARRASRRLPARPRPAARAPARLAY